MPLILVGWLKYVELEGVSIAIVGVERHGAHLSVTCDLNLYKSVRVCVCARL